MEKENNYYAFIPVLVLRDERLSSTAKLLYGEITSLTNMLGYCFATNNYLANLQNLSKTTVSQAISKLQELDYINIEMIYEPNTKQIKERRIYPFMNIGSLKNLKTPDKNLKDPMTENLKTPILENLKDNNINTNNINYIDNNILCSEPLVNVSKPIIELPTNRYNTINEVYGLTIELYNELKECYPNCDLDTELRKMKAWLLTNEIKRRTKKGMPKFINSWLSKNQNNGGNYNAVNQSISKSNDKELSSYERSRRLTVADIEKSRAEFIANLENTKSVFE